MKRHFPLLVALSACLVVNATARADDQTQSVQQALKDQGFYYGNVDGQSGPETDAALRRYQIRQGLDVTGKADEPTLESLNLAGNSGNRKTIEAVPRQPANDDAGTSDAAPAQQSTPAQRVVQSDRQFLENHPAARPTPADDGSIDVTPQQPAAPVAPPPPQQADEGQTLPAQYSTFLRKTPYETAPLVVQRGTIQRAQQHLAREGFFRGIADSELSANLTRAIVAYQRDADLSPTGRLDMPTLSDMNLLPQTRRVLRPAPFYDSYPPPPRDVYRGIWVH